MRIRQFFQNFYLRNLLILIVLLAYGYFLAGARSQNATLKDIVFGLLFYVYVFLWALFHNRILFEFLLLKKKYVLYGLSHILGLSIWILVSKALFGNAINLTQVYLHLLSYLFNAVLIISIYLGYKYIMEKESLYQLNIIKRDIELQQLKTQLNPHFLFNALNNIYSYTLHSNRYGNELILKLSDLMRFILESSEKETILMTDEVRFIENYIAFEKERLGERCILNYEKRIKYPDRKIPPLLLFPFIENAFKYGSNVIQKTEIELLIEDRESSLKMIVKNSIINEKPPSTKKGLPNASRRLELLYPDHHELIISVQEKMFVVDLTLEYDEN